MSSSSSWLFLTTLTVIYIIILYYLNKNVPDAYMDEIFHFPQTQKYCQGKFDQWDSKITTFPGVYLFGTFYAYVASAIGWKANDFCSLSLLRSLNVWFTVGSAYLLIKLRALTLTQKKNNNNTLLHAVMIACFPINFFFSFLLYTDSGATFFVLLMYYLVERNNIILDPNGRVTTQYGYSYFMSAFSGVFAVLFRQTNIVWVLFICGLIVVRYCETFHGKYIYGYNEKVKFETNFSAQISGFQVLLNFIQVCLRNLLTILCLVWPFVGIILGFIIFLILNGGSIVVGDKSNHEAGFHGSQLLYFIFVAATGFGLSHASRKQIHSFATSLRQKTKSFGGIFFIMGIFCLVVFCIDRFSPVHRFMLADNRHYTFYIWRKFFLKHPKAKFLPISLYLYFGWRCYIELRHNRSPLWMLVYCIAVSLVLIPSSLVEPRYYLVPFVIYHLNVRQQPNSQLFLTIAGFILVNTMTMVVFLYKPFSWIDGKTARFMW